MLTRRLRLHVWDNKEGGLSRQWRNVPVSWGLTFFVFGRFGSGWMPLKRLDDKTKAETLLAAQAAGERFQCFVDVFYEQP